MAPQEVGCFLEVIEVTVKGEDWGMNEGERRNNNPLPGITTKMCKKRTRKMLPSEAQEILGNCSGKCKNTQPVPDRQTWSRMEICSLVNWRWKVKQKDTNRSPQSWPKCSFCWLQALWRHTPYPPPSTSQTKILVLHKHYKWLKITQNFAKSHGMWLLLLPAPKCLARCYVINFCTLCQSLPKVFMWSTQAKWTEHLYSIC